MFSGLSAEWGVEGVLAGLFVLFDRVAVFVDFAVAAGAEEDEVVGVGGSVVFPGDDVVDIAGLGSDAAADAAAVSAV